ncbi:MAG: phosphohydrolase [Roseibium sp.]
MDYCVTKKVKPFMGTIAWGKRRGAFSKGRLTRIEKGQVLMNLGRMSALQALDVVLDKAGLINAYGADLDGLLPPETALVRDSLDFAEETQGLDLMRHSWRTYYWAMLLGGYRHLVIDREILFSAAILHDLGLAKDRPVHPGTCCFVVHGAERCKNHLVSKGHDRARVRQIADAIGLHLNGYVSKRIHGAEAHLLSRGAMCDVFGLGKLRVEKYNRDEVYALQPVGDLKSALEIKTNHHLAGTRADFLINLSGKRKTTQDGARLTAAGGQS